MDSVILFLYNHQNVIRKSLFLFNLIPNIERKNVIVKKDDFGSDGVPPIKKYQPIYGKILSFSPKFISVSTKLSDVWDKDFHVSNLIFYFFVIKNKFFFL